MWSHVLRKKLMGKIVNREVLEWPLCWIPWDSAISCISKIQISNILISESNLLSKSWCNCNFQHIWELIYGYFYCHLKWVMCITENVIKKITSIQHWNNVILDSECMETKHWDMHLVSVKQIFIIGEMNTIL